MYLWKYFPSSFLFWLLCAFLQSSSVNRVLEYLKITQFLSHKNFFVNLLLTHHPNHPSLHHVDHHHTIPLFHPSLSLWVILFIFLSNRCTSSFSPNTHFFPPKPCSLPFFSSPQALSGDSAINPSLGRLVLQCLCPALHSLLTDGLKPYQSDLIAGRRPNSAWSLVQASTRAGSISCIIAVDIKNQILSCCSSWGLVSWLIVINSAIRLSPLFSHISQYLLILSSKMLNKVNTRTQILIGLWVPSFTAIFHSLL